MVILIPCLTRERIGSVFTGVHPVQLGVLEIAFICNLLSIKDSFHVKLANY